MNLAFHASRLIGAKVLIIGDIMLDHYQRGLVERISPEAPVPIVRIEDQEYKIGGAGNVAQNIASLGGMPTLVSICGQDAQGETLQELCRASHIQTCLCPSARRQTTLKTRIMAAHQQILRVDRESTEPLNKQEQQILQQTLEPMLEEYQVIVLSDYGKSVISKEFLTWLQGRLRPEQKVLLDPKTRNFPHYKNMYCMTPNAKEAAEGLKIPVKTRAEILEAGQALLREHNFETLVITLGSEGMAVFIPGQGVFHLPTMARRVFDVTGAGDTVIAVIALALSAGFDLLHAAILANCAAGQVVSQVGTARVTQEMLLQSLSESPALHHERWSDLPR